MNDLEGHSKYQKWHDRTHITSYLWSLLTTSLCWDL